MKFSHWVKTSVWVRFLVELV